MKFDISKKKIEKIQNEVIEALEKFKQGSLITIDDFCDPEMWAESTDIFDYTIDVREVVRAIISYIIIEGDRSIIDKAKVVKNLQNKRINEVTSLILEKLKERYLDILTKYYDSVASLHLLVDGNFDISLLRHSSDAFGVYEEITKDRTEEYTYYEDRLSAEMIRRTLLEDFNYVIDQFENSMDLKLLEVDDRMSKQAIKVCYILSKIATKTHEESMPTLADALISGLKLQWLDQYRKNEYYTGLNKESLFLLQYSLEKIQNTFSGDIFKMLNSFRPERVFESLMKYVKK